MAERAYRNLAGYGPLEPLLDDEDVWEIMVSAALVPGRYESAGQKAHQSAGNSRGPQLFAPRTGTEVARSSVSVRRVAAAPDSLRRMANAPLPCGSVALMPSVHQNRSQTRPRKVPSRSE